MFNIWTQFHSGFSEHLLLSVLLNWTWRCWTALPSSTLSKMSNRCFAWINVCPVPKPTSIATPFSNSVLYSPLIQANWKCWMPCLYTILNNRSGCVRCNDSALSGLSDNSNALSRKIQNLHEIVSVFGGLASYPCPAKPQWRSKSCCKRFCCSIARYNS